MSGPKPNLESLSYLAFPIAYPPALPAVTPTTPATFPGAARHWQSPPQEINLQRRTQEDIFKSHTHTNAGQSCNYDQ